MTAVSAPPSDRPAVPVEQRFVLPAVDWHTYQQISRALTGRHVRLTYDGENLEFMNISPAHAKCSRLIARLIVVLTEELNIALGSFGDMTCDRKEFQRGLEPDECFYLTNEPAVRDKEHIDLASDPPPDLAIEVEISRSSRNRMDIYAKLGVPEVWRFDGQTLGVYQLGPDARYSLADRSIFFGNLRIDELATFIHRRSEMEENSLIRSFRAWVREQIRPGTDTHLS